MQKIIPHFWYDKEAKEAAYFYTSIFKDSEIENIRTLKDTPSGDSEIIKFRILGKEFMAISAGPFFKLNPSVSLFVTFENEEEIDDAWKKLIEGGTALMEYSSYPWAKKYGWLQDKFGLSWQLSLSENHKTNQQITPMIMFTGSVAGKAQEAIEYYTDIFDESKIEMMVPYSANDNDKEGFIKHSRFCLDGQCFMAMDSSAQHKFGFNEAISFVVNCDTQEEIDYYWSNLSAVPEAEQCGWIKDKFGLSWQIVPSIMSEMMASGTEEQLKRVTECFLKMKKFDIAKLEEAYGE